VRAQVNVTERSYNQNRTGVNEAETILTPANVSASTNQFHRRFVMKVDGKIEGSPLFLSGVTIAGGVHNVVYVATMHNTVYAFDADTGAQLSARWLGDPVVGEDLGRLKPITIHREWGVAATPVIDPATGTLYVVRWGYENGVNGPTFRLFGLDVSNLGDRFSSANRRLQRQRHRLRRFGKCSVLGCTAAQVAAPKR
jgi:outer membrane protein assembly factor BamB